MREQRSQKGTSSLSLKVLVLVPPAGALEGKKVSCTTSYFITVVNVRIALSHSILHYYYTLPTII